MVSNALRVYATLHKDHADGATELEIIEALARTLFWAIASEVTPQQINGDQLKKLHVGLSMTWCEGEDHYHGGKWAKLMHSDEGSSAFIKGYDGAKDEFLGLGR